MEAPEKIYMTPSFGEPDNVLLASFSKSHLNFHKDIEYVRTDAFIERACAWIGNNYCAYDSNSHYDKELFIEEFRKYMKGE